MNHSPLGAMDLHLFNEGTHGRLYDKLGAHFEQRDGVNGTRFAVWAPNAARVGVVGEFNDWQGPVPLAPVSSSGIWEAWVSGVTPGTKYKYRIESNSARWGDRAYVDKGDPLAFFCEPAPGNASIVWSDEYQWQDEEWLNGRHATAALSAPVSIYEVHLGSWMRPPEEPTRFLSYRELAPRLVEHLEKTGFTHVELLPIMEHPFYGSWGYQVTGYFAPTSRYGCPSDFKYLIDTLHQNGIGVILDWVPAHFPTDEHGLGYFDGTHAYEHEDPRQGIHAEWRSAIYNYGRNEVRSFLISSALFWMDYYHIDGVRVDAVASMLYLDYGRQGNDWVPNRYGGNENLEAIEFMRTCNRLIYERFPDALVIAEESTAWPMVSRPVYMGGLGFGLKWDMGFMHDTLEYMSKDPVYRSYMHGKLTFRSVYAASENYVLPFSHDEVVHGKGSMLGKMPGDTWQRFANLRLLYAYTWAQPGKKLLFMGGEFGQLREWNHDQSLDWHLLSEDAHHGQLQLLVGELNGLYRSEPALHEADVDSAGFEWIDANDSVNSVLSFIRKTRDGKQEVLCVFNFTPVPRRNYRIGTAQAGLWREVLNTDAAAFGGSGQGNMGAVEATPVRSHGRPYSLNLTLPPLGALFLRPETQS